LYNGSNGHGGGFSSGVLLVFFWVLLGSSGLLVFFCVIEHQKNTRRTPEEHQKERQKNPEGEEHQPPLLNDNLAQDDRRVFLCYKNIHARAKRDTLIFGGIPSCCRECLGALLAFAPLC
jgi:hypothetical protein